jgi:hypothetical protein
MSGVMARGSIWLVLLCTALIFAISCSPESPAPRTPPRSFHPIIAGVDLRAVIANGKGGMPALRVVPVNNGLTPVNIRTGLTAYPAAGFEFQITLRDGRVFLLFCDVCGNGGIAPGRVINYWVELLPGKTWYFDIPLQGFFYVDSGDRRLNNIAASQATVATTLRGVSALNDIDRVEGKNVWQGAVSAKFTLPVFSRRVQRWLAAGGDYARRFPVTTR